MGRLALVERLKAALEAPGRLITLWGPPGFGKTTLALELAHTVAEHMTVWFVDLSSVHNAEGLSAALSHQLGLKSGSDAVSGLGAGLLVLDNFEQLISLGPTTVGAWLDQSEDLKILATSRERLNLRGERVVEIPPLDLAQGAEAEALFLERARALRADLGERPEDQRRVQTIVRRLEGIPLALELAAARVDVLGLEGLERRLEAQLSLLDQGPLDAPERHATLEGAIAWSWQMLSEPERSRLAACAVFRGGFSLDAAEAVLPGPSQTIPIIEQLRRKSLLTTSEPGPSGEVRLGLFEAIRQFMEARLVERGELEAVSKRHTEYFAKLGATKAGEEAPTARRWLRLESQNLLSVFERELDRERDSALSALLALLPIYSAQGPYEVYLSLLERALSKAQETPAPLRAQLLRARGKTLQLLGHHERAERDLEDASQGAEQGSLQHAQLLIDLGVLHHQRRALDKAERCYQQALELQRARNDRQGEGRVLGNIGALFHDRRDLEPAKKHYERALDLFRSTRARRQEGLYLANLGVLEHEREQMQEAQHYYTRALEILEDVQDQRLVAITLGNRGLLQQEMGTLQQALESHLAARPLLQHAGEHRSLGFNLMRLGMVRAQLGQREQAERDLQEAKARMSHPEDLLGLGLIELASGFLKITEAHEAWLAGQMERATELSLQVEAKLERAKDELLDRSDDARLIDRMLRRQLPAIQGLAADKLPEDSLVFGAGARWFRDPESHWRDFRRRRPLRRLLLALIERRMMAPGVGLSMEELLSAAWPDERIQPASAANRLYVALATLRKQGLKRVLLTEEEGYLLDPKVKLFWSSVSAKEIQFEA